MYEVCNAFVNFFTSGRQIDKAALNAILKSLVVAGKTRTNIGPATAEGMTYVQTLFAEHPEIASKRRYNPKNPTTFQDSFDPIKTETNEVTKFARLRELLVDLRNMDGGRRHKSRRRRFSRKRTQKRNVA